MSFTLIDVCGHPAFSAPLVNFVLFLMSVAAMLLERAWVFARSAPISEIQAARRAAQYARLDRSAQRRAMERAVRANRHELARGVDGLLTIGLTAPLVGLAGLVYGFINAFRGVALTGSGGFGAVSAGFAEALVPFAAGLAIGLIALWSYAYLQAWLERITVRMKKVLS